jgi:hypothetical protein
VIRLRTGPSAISEVGVAAICLWMKGEGVGF